MISIRDESRIAGVHNYRCDQQNYDNYTSPFLSREREDRSQTIFLFARSIVSARVPRRLPKKVARSEIIARYRPQSEESFISDFWATEARKSNTQPLSRNFGQLIITSRAENSRARASADNVT